VLRTVDIVNKRITVVLRKKASKQRENHPKRPGKMQRWFFLPAAAVGWVKGKHPLLKVL
jgi:hypothetical protein